MPLEKSLKGVCKALREIKEEGLVKGFALIGGLSVSTWGYPRATNDVDLLVGLASIERLDAFSSALERRGFKTDIRSGGLADPVPYLIRTSRDDVPVDIIIATKNWEHEACEQAVTVSLDGADIPVAPVEYIIVMKLRAGSPRDLADVSELLKTSELRTGFLKGLAKRLRVDRKLEGMKKG
ncbi:MAG: nucleotidyl transferase AbiEii/AbiGii toxin family protein [Deltaproteobacteria bacterium]|nr:nucleotidyl transferase AbiEii/AbiGii toxin family protein [Deltaproteobacteria bacterium]